MYFVQAYGANRRYSTVAVARSVGFAGVLASVAHVVDGSQRHRVQHNGKTVSWHVAS